jgi:hypothetical protein
VSSFVYWPESLVPQAMAPNPVAMTRGGARSLGGVERVARTDVGFWSIAYRRVPLTGPGKHRLWNALRTSIGGRAGLVVVPVWQLDLAPWPDGGAGVTTVPHSDGSLHSDGAPYVQGSIDITAESAAAIGATSIVLRINHAEAALYGIRFSYDNALYETGLPTGVSGDLWTVPIFPAVRAAIPAGAQLEVDNPTCLCRLASDRAMDNERDTGRVSFPDVAFVEAVDYWSDLAAL